MQKRRKYSKLIDAIKNNNSDRIVLDQKYVKRIMGDDLPKSIFNERYIKQRSNELARFIMDNNDIYELEIVQPQLVLKRRKSSL